MYCRNCGHQMSDHVNFCPKCGQKISEVSVDTEKESSKKSPCLFIIVPGDSVGGFPGDCVEYFFQEQK